MWCAGSCRPRGCDSGGRRQRRDPRAIQTTKLEWPLGFGRLIDDAALSGQLREAGRRRAKEYTWDRTAVLTTEAYRAAVNRAPARLTLPMIR